MTCHDSALVLYVYKGHWEDALFPSSYFVSCTTRLLNSSGFPPSIPPGYPCLLKGTYLYLRDLYL
jgi:hypothetical protein